MSDLIERLESVNGEQAPYANDLVLAWCHEAAAALRSAAAREAALVEALEQATLQIEYLHEKFQPTGSGNAVAARARAALAAAKETRSPQTQKNRPPPERGA
jgi:hypothetical protein